MKFLVVKINTAYLWFRLILCVCLFYFSYNISFAQLSPFQITSYPNTFNAETMVSDTANNLDFIYDYNYINSVKQITKLRWVNALNYNISEAGDAYGQGSGTIYSKYATRAQYSNNRVYAANCPTYGRLTCYDKQNDNLYYWQINPAAGYVSDFEIRNDSLVVVMDSTSQNAFKGLYILNKNTGAKILQTTLSANGYGSDAIVGVVKKVKLFGRRILIGGKFSGQAGNMEVENFMVYDLDSARCLKVNLNINDTVNDIEIHNNRICIVGSFTSVKGAGRTYWALINSNFTLFGQTFFFNGPIKEVEIHGKDMLLVTSATNVNYGTVNTGFPLNAVLLDINASMPYTWVSPFTANYPTLFRVQKSRLFMADASGMFKVHCLAPTMQAGFTAATSTVCQGQNQVVYSIVGAINATTYTWSYTGSNVTILPAGRTATVNYGANATSGTLKIFAKSFCGNVSDTLKLSITVRQTPNLSVWLTKDTINCHHPKVALFSNSSTSNVSYQWTGPYGYSSTQKNDSTPYKKAGKYVMTVTNNIGGCKRKDSVLVKIDTILPGITPPSSQVGIYCKPDSSLLNGSSSTNPSVLWWRKTGDSFTHTNPYYIKQPGNYYLMVQNTYNGCKDSTVILVKDKKIAPNAKIVSHTYVNPVTPIDTVTCIKPTVTISGASDTSGVSVLWKDIPGNNTFSNPVNTSAQGNFKLIITRNDNGCADSSIICLVTQNIIKPGINIQTINPEINCSQPSVTLQAISTQTDAVLQWNGPGSFSSSNPAITTVAGKYYITATNPNTNCSKIDSIQVSQSNSLSVSTSGNKIVCKNVPVFISASVNGNVTDLNYIWSNGGTSSSISVSALTNTSYVVYVTAPNSCSGSATVNISVSPDMQDSIITSKTCGSGGSGNAVIFTKGGTPPYLYSLNGSSHSSQSFYNNIPFGDYLLNIRDSVGCEKVASFSINDNSNLPQPVFIASTHNEKSDTIVLVDLTQPRADSVQWILPAGAIKIGGDMFNPVVVFPDTGHFTVIQKAFFGTCIINTNKIIYVFDKDSSYAKSNNNNGIKSFKLYPNPNNGLFTVEVEFYKKQNAAIQVWDGLSQKHFQQNFSTSLFISLPVNISYLQNGNYILKVIGEYSSQYLHFVINR